MSNPTISPSSFPTLKSLIEQKIIEKDLSRPDLVRVIGYTNLSKGCKRLDAFLKTLESPSERFITKLLSVLDIDVLSFNKAICASLDQLNAEYHRTFNPYIEIILGVQVSPFFAYQAAKNQCSVPVPAKLQNQPFMDEIEAISTLYKEHIDNRLSDNIVKHIIGFKYHREYNYYLRFDSNFLLEETAFVQPMPSGKILLGNRVVDMLSGGKG